MTYRIEKNSKRFLFWQIHNHSLTKVWSNFDQSLIDTYQSLIKLWWAILKFDQTLMVDFKVWSNFDSGIKVWSNFDAPIKGWSNFDMAHQSLIKVWNRPSKFDQTLVGTHQTFMVYLKVWSKFDQNLKLTTKVWSNCDQTLMISFKDFSKCDQTLR